MADKANSGNSLTVTLLTSGLGVVFVFCSYPLEMIETVLLKYFCVGSQCLQSIEELWGEGKNYFECLIMCTTLLSFFFQEKKEHKRTQRAAVRKLKDRHDASLAHPHFSSLSGDF